MNHLKLRTVLITALALGAVQASFASGCRWPCDPPTPRNGWQPASPAKALPQSAAVQAAPGASLTELPAAASKTLPQKATVKARLQAANDR